MQQTQVGQRPPVLLGSALCFATRHDHKAALDKSFHDVPVPEPMKIAPSEALDDWRRISLLTAPPLSPASVLRPPPGLDAPSQISQDGHGCSGDGVAACVAIMRNIPSKYKRNMLLDLLDRMGFKGAYVLVYLPIDFCSKVAVGYAFVGFRSTEDAARFRTVFHGFNDWGCQRSSKVCDVCWSDNTHSLDDHVQRYRNSPVMHHSVPDEYRPALFDTLGERLSFPAPTRAPRKPRGHGRDVRKWSNRA